jgi:hypothetical protein
MLTPQHCAPGLEGGGHGLLGADPFSTSGTWLCGGSLISHGGVLHLDGMIPVGCQAALLPGCPLHPGKFRKLGFLLRAETHMQMPMLSPKLNQALYLAFPIVGGETIRPGHLHMSYYITPPKKGPKILSQPTIHQPGPLDRGQILAMPI